MVAATVCVAASACRDAWANSASAETRTGKAPTYSGESIFVGVTLGKGDVAKRLATPSAKAWDQINAKLDEAERVKLSAAVDSVVGRIDTADPKFFSRYQAEMQSGSALRVMAAMDEAHKLLVQVTTPQNYAPNKIDDSQKGCLLLVLAVGVVLINVAVVLNFDIAANFVTVANIATVVNAVSVGDNNLVMNGDDGKLARDQFVGLVAQRLATQ